MIPIGIVSRDRAAYLDLTLRSLSASEIDGASVTLFDDHSTDKATQRYYQTNKVIENIRPKFPNNKVWNSVLGLGAFTNHDYLDPVGIQGKVNIICMDDKPLGVVNGSCVALKHMFEANPDAPGVILLQDDIVFKEDWYEQLIDTARRWKEYAKKPIGVLAGIKINQGYDIKGKIAIGSGITAQCLYVSRLFYDKSPYLKTKHKINKRFDDMLRRAVAKAGLWGGVKVPFICQHIGVKSLVRPKKRWKIGSKGRVGYYVKPPYVMADEVARFK